MAKTAPVNITARNEPAIECSPIRLTVEETKQILRLAVAGKPVSGEGYQSKALCSALADMGIVRRIEIAEEKITTAKIEDCWKKARAGLAIKDEEKVHQAMHDIESLTRDRDRNQPHYMFALTDLGKQIARGISVRMNGQYRRG